ncbi:MAG: protein-glutamate O-methyltransferase CheR, partial [Croceibacterium sp.]
MSGAGTIDPGQVALGIVAGLLETRTGQKLTADRAWRVGTALSGVLRRYELATLEQLVEKLGTPGYASLAQQVVEALLNNETYFFRDRAMFDHLGQVVLPELHRRRASRRRLAIWSVGCSTGQEAYSLAMLFAEQAARWRDWTIDILGTDVAPSVVAAARDGHYSQFQIQRGLGAMQMVTSFEETRTGWRATEALRQNVRFATHNLLETAPAPGRFDLILCRNVLLYFDTQTRTRAFERLAEALAPDGRVMLGAGETTVGQTRVLAPEKGSTGFHR